MHTTHVRPLNAPSVVADSSVVPALIPASTCLTPTTHVRPLNATCVVLPSLAQSCWLQSVKPFWFQLEFPTSASDFTPLTVPNLWVWNSAPSSSCWIYKYIYHSMFDSIERSRTNKYLLLLLLLLLILDGMISVMKLVMLNKNFVIEWLIVATPRILDIILELLM